jgi:hypothetical protein
VAEPGRAGLSHSTKIRVDKKGPAIPVGKKNVPVAGTACAKALRQPQNFYSST